jgi:sigma-B regulation protein RsbU (phosphoserine phosphatase)
MTTDEVEVVVDVSQNWVLACDVQQRFMRGWTTAQCRQVRALGGDCYDLMPLTDDRLALAVGDASGKGLAAALMIASVQSSVRTAALFTGNDLAALLKIVNLQAYASSLTDRYATIFYGVFDPATRTLRYVNAGHTPPIILPHNGSVDPLEMGGAPVGMFPDSSYEEGAVQLDPGDVVITYTDGVIEACEPARSGEFSAC